MIELLLLLGALPAWAEDLVLAAPLEAARTTPVYAQLAGMVRTIAAHEGQTVAAGDTLVCLDDTDLRLAAEEYRLAYLRAQRFFDRVQQLQQRSLISAQELEDAQYQAQTAHLRLQRAQLDLSRAVILAPTAGQVADLQIQQGSLASLHQEVLAWSTAAPTPKLQGHLVRLSPVVDPQNGLSRAEVLFPDAGRRLRPGTVVQVQLKP